MSSERGILQTTLPWQAGLRRYVGPPFLLGMELYWAKVMFGHETVFYFSSETPSGKSQHKVYWRQEAGHV